MLTRIMALYKSPMARIGTNEALSVPFTISNGTRQGCPLPPLILILTLEPFLCAVKVNPSIQSLKSSFPFKWEKVSLSTWACVYLLILLSSISLIFCHYCSLWRTTYKDVCTSWFCKVKMNTLPHLLYLMQVVPIRLPSRYLRTLQKMIVRFVWSGARPWLKYALLCAPKGELASRISGCIIELAYLVALWNWGVTDMQRPGSRWRKA